MHACHWHNIFAKAVLQNYIESEHTSPGGCVFRELVKSDELLLNGLLHA